MSSFKVLDVQALVQEAAQRLLKSAIARNIDLGFECFAHPRVRGDALLLEELVSNLVDNALRYAGEGAVVTVRVFTQDNEACICVEDDGPGVTPQELPRLTERFHRATGASAGGSGLGLAIVQEIAHLHGGRLDMASVAPHGLRVTTRLPVYLPTTPE
jgi:two-component system sensor histidine kinase TctE